jgi:hypothetical protein
MNEKTLFEFSLNFSACAPSSVIRFIQILVLVLGDLVKARLSLVFNQPPPLSALCTMHSSKSRYLAISVMNLLLKDAA